MPLIVDASVLVKLVVDEPGSSQAVALLDRDESRMAPDWIMVEVANALWNKVKFSHLLEIHAEDSLSNAGRFIDGLVPATELLKEAFALSFRMRHPVYDCLYVALAVREGGVVVTADRDLYRAASGANLGKFVELLGGPEKR